MPALDVPGARLNYRLDGPAEAPVIVLANSLGTALAVWDGQIAVLARTFRVLRYDMRGQGASSVSTLPVDVPTLAGDVLALLDATQAATAHFLGLSLGGMVGLWLGIHKPERLKTLMVANTAALIGTRAAWDARIELIGKAGMDAIVETVLDRWVTPGFRARAPERVESLRRMLLEANRAGYIAACAAVRDVDLRGSAAEVRVPTLVITGDMDTATPPSDGRWLAQRIPGARHIELEAAHLSNVEAEPAFNHGVVGFLSTQGETRWTNGND